MEVATQTELSLLDFTNTRAFSRNLHLKTLSCCHSIFIQNTLGDDDSPLIVDLSSQTFETGGLSVENCTQTNMDFDTDMVYTENCLSSTDNPVVSFYHQLLFESQDQPLLENEEPYLVFNSFSQTILM